MALLHSLGHDYVVAARLRSMKAEELHKVTGALSWQATSDGRKATEVIIGDRRLILRYCPMHAAKNAHEREQAVKNARKRLASGVKGSGRKGRYLKVDRNLGMFKEHYEGVVTRFVIYNPMPKLNE